MEIQVLLADNQCHNSFVAYRFEAVASYFSVPERPYWNQSPENFGGVMGGVRRVAAMLAVEENMKFNFRRIAGVKTSSLLAIAGALALTQFANANTLTDTSNNVTYDLTSTFTAVTDNTYDVFLAVDASKFNANGITTGFLNAVALQFQTPSTVTLINAPGGTSDWSSVPGGLSSNGCQGSGNFECWAFSDNGGASDNATKVPSASLLVFEFSVQLPVGTSLSAANHIKTLFTTTRDGNGNQLGDLVSQDVITDQCSGASCGTVITLGSTPEPSTILMAISGLGLLGLGSLRKIRS
jgi:hypothetical protein